MTLEAGLARLDELVDPLGGVVGRAVRLTNAPGEPAVAVFSGGLGDVGRVLPGVRDSAGGSTRYQFDGAGAGIDPDRARAVAIAEALERYATCVFSDEQMRWATAAELGDEALDLRTVPRCTPDELAHPGCPVTDVDLEAPIRWVRGVSLMTLRPTWVPAVMTFLHLRPAATGERFTLPISTGCAAHTRLDAALVGGLCEVIERDAIALTWLARLPLARIELDGETAADGDLAVLVDRGRRSSVEQLLFDATTELGVPTVYCLDRAASSRKLARMVTCCSALDPQAAVVKALRESASSRIGLAVERDLPDDPDAFISVYHGADWMGRPERTAAFAFLEDSPARRPLADMPAIATGDPAADLRLLLGRLRAADMEAFAVDLTVDEARAVGFRVIRVIVPALQPLSFSFRARFLAHPRLREATTRLGHPPFDPAAANPWPQPFA